MRKPGMALVEVTLLYVLIIGMCRVLFQYRSVHWVSATLALWVAALFLYVPVLLLFLFRETPEAWGITLRGFRGSIRIASLLSLICLPAYVLMYEYYVRYWLHIPFRISLPDGWAMLLLYHFVCVAFPEEVFYRGYMQSRLDEAFPGGVKVLSARLGFGWIYTAVLFALGHYLIDFRPETLATFFPGLVFGWLRSRTGSVVASTLFHALCNGTVLLLS